MCPLESINRGRYCLKGCKKYQVWLMGTSRNLLGAVLTLLIVCKENFMIQDDLIVLIVELNLREY